MGAVLADWDLGQDRHQELGQDQDMDQDRDQDVDLGKAWDEDQDVHQNVDEDVNCVMDYGIVQGVTQERIRTWMTIRITDWRVHTAQR